MDTKLIEAGASSFRISMDKNGVRERHRAIGTAGLQQQRTDDGSAVFDSVFLCLVFRA